MEKRKSQTDLQHQYENFLHNLKTKTITNWLFQQRREFILLRLPILSAPAKLRAVIQKFHLADKKTVTTSKDLKEYDQILSDHDFIRVHRTHLINRSYINSISGDHQFNT